MLPGPLYELLNLGLSKEKTGDLIGLSIRELYGEGIG